MRNRRIKDKGGQRDASTNIISSLVQCTWSNLFTLSMTFEIVTDDLWGLPSVLSTVVLLAAVTACTGGDDSDDVTVLRALLCTVFGRVLDVEVVVTTFRVSPKNKIIVRQFFNGASCKLIWQCITLTNIKHYFSTLTFLYFTVLWKIPALHTSLGNFTIVMFYRSI